MSARRPVTDSRAPERKKCPPALWATSHSSLGDGLLLQTSHVPWSAWSYVPGTSVVSNAKTTVPIEMPFRRERSHTCVDCGPKDGWGAHWRHLVNTIERSVCVGDAALCLISLTTSNSLPVFVNPVQVLGYTFASNTHTHFVNSALLTAFAMCHYSSYISCRCPVLWEDVGACYPSAAVSTTMLIHPRAASCILLFLPLNFWNNLTIWKHLARWFTLTLSTWSWKLERSMCKITGGKCC